MPPHSRRARSAILGLLVAAAVLGACGTSGRTLRDPEPGVTAPPRKTSSTTSAAVDTVPAAGLSIVSPGWSPGGPIPERFTCDGPNVSPPLTITGVPQGTAELVVLVTDPDADGFRHWVVSGLTPEAPDVPEGGLPAGAVESPNSTGTPGWFGPCPPSGTTHTYDVTVYALPQPSGLEATSDADQVDAAVAQATSTAVTTGSYGRA